MPAHEENWVVFPREVDDAPALLRVDVGWANEEHDGLAHPAMLEFSVQFRDPDPQMDGAAPGPDEFEVIGALEDELVAALETIGGVFVAAMGSNNTRRWICYAPSAEASAQAVLAGLKNPAGYDFEVRIGEDPSWSMYHDFFLPDDAEMSMIANEGVFEALADGGDIPERERPIEHLAYLPTEKAADQFAKWATRNGFTIMNRFESEDAEEGMPSFAVEFSKVRAATMDEVMPDINAATEEAERLDGFYDGWQTATITE